VWSDKEQDLISDNNDFDWQFINWYFHHFVGSIHWAAEKD